MRTVFSIFFVLLKPKLVNVSLIVNDRLMSKLSDNRFEFGVVDT